MTKWLTVIIAIALTAPALSQTISSSWGWKTSHVYYGDVSFSYPVKQRDKVSYSVAVAGSHSFNGAYGALAGFKRLSRLGVSPHFWLLQQIETGASYRHAAHFSTQGTLGLVYRITPKVGVSSGLKVNKTISAPVAAVVFIGVGVRIP